MSSRLREGRSWSSICIFLMKSCVLSFRIHTTMLLRVFFFFFCLFIDKKLHTKSSIALRNNMSMVIVPCWWDGKAESLAATIQYTRPDMPFHDFKQMIPLNPPRGFFLSSDLPNVGELMLASFPQDIHLTLSPNSWWMGEKYDGIRCCWNPSEGVLYTRSGREIPFPSFMRRRLPKYFIDGEFWFGRGQFAAACMLVTGSPEHLEGQFLRLMAFDNPRNKLQKLPFEERYKILVQTVFPGHPFIQVAQRVLCKNYTHLNWSIHCIVDDEGEGVILRKIKTKYEHGRTPNLLKLKMSKGDREAVVVEKRLEDNSLVIALPNGRVVPVPATHIHVPLPDVGAIVSFFYENYSRNRDVPVHPQVYRVRADLAWQDVVSSAEDEENYMNEQESANNNQLSQIATTNMRLFLEDFARSRNLDPYKAETWYNIPYKIFYNNKGARAILQKFRGGYYKALLHVFPDIGLNAETFNKILWTDVNNRRKFFELFAQKFDFDPLVPDNWYTQQRDIILAMKGAARVLSYHDNSVTQALVDLFPDIGLDKTKFHSSYRYIDSRVKFFMRYAAKMNFDPLVPENWYKIPKEDLESFKGADKVISYHKNNVHKALMELFPDVAFDSRKFKAGGIYLKPEARRLFFENYAKEKGFDPLVPEHWYDQSRDVLYATKGFFGVLGHHGFSLARALIELFPEVGFDATKFSSRLSMWASEKLRRKFFDNFAAKESFDPLVAENWYKYSYEDMINAMPNNKVVPKIAKYHGMDLRQSLIDLYPTVNFDISQLFKTTDKEVLSTRFFNKYAAKYGFDPLVPENWYQQPYDLIAAEPEFSETIVTGFKNVAIALVVAFPGTGLSTSAYTLHHLKREKEKIRQFFGKYAAAHNFDPFVAANWYRQPSAKMANFKGASTVLPFFGNDPKIALVGAFPELNIDKTRFQTQLEYRERSVRRLFFENYAKEHNFDPLEPHNWYIQPIARINATKGARKVLHYYGRSVPKALLDLFPSIGLEKAGFQARFVFKDPKVRRKFFESFAITHNFDPLIADNWYSVRREHLQSVPGAFAILDFHRSYAKALIELFPEIGLELNKFPSLNSAPVPTKNSSLKEPPGGSRYARRKFFEEYAKIRNFDPLIVDNWYQEHIPRIMTYKGSGKVVSVHGSIVNALIDLFPEVQFDRAGFHRRRR
eukprot:Phypoly_transcript_01010.p1 GENE.Phypoly_transcript_01010~~Phypoly_transcript_01010.p1  ORF type:complete len:1168 (+),score=148.17 Phypoly_transcript_01010:225-3728(+)